MRTERVIGSQWRWVDLENPSLDELESMAQEGPFPRHLIQDCLDPVHLPKLEQSPEGTFLLLRVFDEQARPGAVSARELTRKCALFWKPGLVLTVHRAPLRFLQNALKELPGEGSLVRPNRLDSRESQDAVLLDLCHRAMLTYEGALEASERVMEGLDEAGGERFDVDGSRLGPDSLYRLHLERRKLATLKRVLWHMLALFQRLPVEEGKSRASLKALSEQLRENTEKLLFFADSLLDEVQDRIHLELNLSAQQNNDVMRVLTLFSAFFMPLTFMVGVYGMNFVHMPELQWPWAYPALWGAMLVVVLGLGAWFRRKGWL